MKTKLLKKTFKDLLTVICESQYRNRNSNNNNNKSVNNHIEIPSYNQKNTFNMFL